MPLNKKGKKILASMEKQYGKKKGKTVFYAMENSGKLKGIKAARGSAVDTGDFGTEAANIANLESGNAQVGYSGGDGGGSNQVSAPTKSTGTQTSGGGTGLLNIGRSLLTLGASKLFEAPVGAITTGVKAVKNLTTDFANKPTLMSKKFVDTGDQAFYKKPNYNLGQGNMSGDSSQVCPDGGLPPCKTPTTQIKNPVSTPNPFLSGFQAYDDGGEVVVSSNVDKSLL